MNIFVPSYYPNFACIAGKCRHTCCKGWEIDVDADTYEAYKKTDGPFGERLRASIDEDGDGAHFRLDAEERCPFLNTENLCDIIVELGEGALCQICTDHPRYRNFFSDRVEMGLGLCCEAAAELILSRKERPVFIRLSGEEAENPDEEEAYMIELRETLLDMAFDDTRPIEERFASIAEKCGICPGENTAEEWKELYGTLEILHEEWKMHLEHLGEGRMAKNVPEPQLFAYFLCRHLPGALSDGRYRARIAFALHATAVITMLSAFLPVEEAARAYSEEIEYSAENMEKILEYLDI